MVHEWFYNKGGQRVGPVSDQELKELAASGELQPADLVWREGMAEWAPAQKVKGLFAGLSRVGPPPLPTTSTTSASEIPSASPPPVSPHPQVSTTANPLAQRFLGVPRWTGKKILVGTGIVVFLGLVAILLVAWPAAQKAARRTESSGNMMKICLAVHKYRDEHGVWPESLDQVADQVPPKRFINPITGDNPGYEYVTPGGDPNPKLVMLYQLRHGKRDASLEVGFGDCHIGALNEQGSVQGADARRSAHDGSEPQPGFAERKLEPPSPAEPKSNVEEKSVPEVLTKRSLRELKAAPGSSPHEMIQTLARVVVAAVNHVEGENTLATRLRRWTTTTPDDFNRLMQMAAKSLAEKDARYRRFISLEPTEKRTHTNNEGVKLLIVQYGPSSTNIQVGFGPNKDSGQYGLFMAIIGNTTYMASGVEDNRK